VRPAAAPSVAPSVAPSGLLADERLDVLVVGGGIVGACIALEAATRGLRTALVDRGDFGGGATSNCLKIVHGGLRYVQHLDWRRMRESITERSMWLRSAPHLVEPLPVVMPTWRGRFPPRAALAGALAMNEAVSYDRNRGLLPDRLIPAARVLSRRTCAEMLPVLDAPGLTGGVLFHDAIMYSPERLTLEVIAAARRAGATVANYVELLAPLRTAHALRGVRLRDRLADEELDVRARWVVNATGSSVPDVADRLGVRGAAQAQRYSVALNFVTSRPAPAAAFTIAGGAGDPDRVVRSGGRQLFVVPWRGQMMVGTAHLEFAGDPATYELQEAHVDAFLSEIAAARPALGLARDEISLVHWGLLPVAGSAAGGVRLLKQHSIIPHAAEGLSGAFSVVSVKFTTARSIAVAVVDAITGGRRKGAQDEARLPLPGADFESLDELRRQAHARYGTLLAGDALEHLLRTYGAGHVDVMALRETVPDWDRQVVPGSPVIYAQLVHGALAELGRTAEDLVWRRTEIGPRGLATAGALRLAEQALLEAAAPPDGPG
jgi:glycerol-3-phosphate dehydrogenase